MNDAAEKHLLERFFNEEVNVITLDHVQRDRDLQRWADRLVRLQAPTVLPLMTPNRQVWWHAIARTESELRALSEGLEAFLGPTYADLTGARVDLDTEHPVGAALHAYSQGRVLRFRADLEQVRPALNRMFALWEARPERTARDTRSPGVLRLAFEMALRARNADAAREALATLRDSGTLNAANDIFLQVQYLSNFNRWHDLLALPNLRDLLALRRPTAVTDALLRAVYHVHLASSVCANDGTAAQRALHEQVMPLYSALLEERKLRSAEAWTVMATAAAVRKNITTLETSANYLTDLGGVGVELAQRWLDALRAEQIPETEVEIAGGAPLETARRALLQNDPASAIAHAAKAPNTPERALLLLQAAVLLQTLDAARTALAALNDLDKSERQRLVDRPLVRRYYEMLQPAEDARGTGLLPPTSWKTWLDRLIEDSDWPSAEIRRTAALGAYEWTLDSLLAEGAPETVAARLMQIPDVRIDSFAEALPYLLDTIQGDPRYPNPHLEPLYRTLLEHLALLDAPTLSDVRVYMDLLPAVLEARLSAEAYAEVIDNVLTMLEVQRASPPPNLILDGLDALVMYPCRDPEARLRALTAALELQRRYNERWDNEDQAFLAQLAREIGVPDLVEGLVVEESVREQIDPLEMLADQYVAIYTLTESAAQRAQTLIEAAAPGVRVEVSHAHVGNERLKAMAQHADVFVMVPASAKHAATGFISTYREGRPLIEPTGKGSSSLLRSLRDYCAGNQTPS